MQRVICPLLPVVLLLLLLPDPSVEAAGKSSGRRGGRQGPVTLAGFTTLAHKVSSGDAVIKDSRTILIKSFSYDGAGPDAFFLVGKGEPNAKGRKIADENGDYDVLKGYVKQDIELTLPSDLSWKDVDYLSVYCISFRHNFGYITIPKNLNVPEYEDDKKE